MSEVTITDSPYPLGSRGRRVGERGRLAGRAKPPAGGPMACGVAVLLIIRLLQQ